MHNRHRSLVGCCCLLISTPLALPLRKLRSHDVLPMPPYFRIQTFLTSTSTFSNSAFSYSTSSFSSLPFHIFDFNFCFPFSPGPGAGGPGSEPGARGPWARNRGPGTGRPQARSPGPGARGLGVRGHKGESSTGLPRMPSARPSAASGLCAARRIRCARCLACATSIGSAATYETLHPPGPSLSSMTRLSGPRYSASLA